MSDKNNERQLPLKPEQIEQIQCLAQGLKYGSITLVFQDGVLIQADRSEKIRFAKTPKTTN